MDALKGFFKEFVKGFVLPFKVWIETWQGQCIQACLCFVFAGKYVEFGDYLPASIFVMMAMIAMEFAVEHFRNENEWFDGEVL